MDIYINDQKIDFKLENEELVHEVVSGLRDWTKSEGYQISNILIDEEPYASENTDAGNIPIRTVSCLRVEAKSRFDIHQDNLQLLYQYVSLFLKSIEGVNAPLIKDLKLQAPSAARLLAEFLEEQPDSSETISSSLLSNILGLDENNMDSAPELLQVLTGQLGALKLILNERISELSNPLGELSKTISALKMSQQEFNEISVLLQTGKDKEALGSIIKFSELSQKALRLYPLLENGGYSDISNLEIDGRNITAYYDDLNEILTELIEAFTANDYVLIGDLLEYEVSPRLEVLLSVLDSILKENQS